MNTCCKAVIFDLDGTILDTLHDLADAMNITLEKFGFPKRELSHHRKAIGNGLRLYAKRCIPEDKVSDELLDEFVPVAAEDYNKRNEFVNTLAAHYFPDYSFDCVYGELPGIAKKPDPAAALKIATDCNIAPEDIVFIGDSIYDVIAGKNAGMKTIAVTWGNQDRVILESENPDFIADTAEEIIEYIKTLNK